MYTHQDKEMFAAQIVLISTVPFAVLTAIAIITAVKAAL